MKGRTIGGDLAQVAVYKGEELLVSGTIRHCAKVLGVQSRTIYFYLMPEYKRRVERRKNSSGNVRSVVLI